MALPSDEEAEYLRNDFSQGQTEESRPFDFEVKQTMGSQRIRHDFTFTFTFHFHALEKEMATHSIVLAWRIPGMAEPGGLLSMGWHRVRHD